MQPYQAHAYAEIFPRMNEEALKELAADIGENGLRSPIVLYQGRILDGANRQAACLLAKVEPQFVDYDGDDALKFVISANLSRRHLTESQRAMVAAKLANMKQGGDRGKTVERPLSNKEAGKLLKTSDKSVRRAKQVQREGIPELAAAVESGDIAVTPAAEIAGLPKSEQKAALQTKKSAARRPPPRLVKPKAVPMISEKLNSLIWSRASLDERRRFLDAIGMNSLIEAIPPSWTPLLTEHFAVRAPAPSNSFDIPADLSIPEFMRRTRMDNEEKKHE